VIYSSAALASVCAFSLGTPLPEFARCELLRALAGEPGRVEVMRVGRYQEVSLPAGELQLSSRVAAHRFQPRLHVWVDVSLNGRVVRSIPVAFDVRWIRPALVTREPLAAKLPLNESQVVLREIDAAGSHGEPLVHVAQLRGKRLRRALGGDAVIGLEDIEDQPPVAAGEKIDVYAKVGGVVVRTAGVAQRDGFNGDRINVRLANRPETLRVQVVGVNRAAVIENANSQSIQ
jgi:flagella basal body P-ring formation protein FlgA